jgi:hypothetical protein
MPVPQQSSSQSKRRLLTVCLLAALCFVATLVTAWAVVAGSFSLR